MNQKSYHITVNINAALEECRIGIRRAYCFLGFGNNAAQSEHLNEIHLPDPPHLFLVPQKLEQDSINNIKHNFKIWVGWNCLRELTESYSVLLNGVYEALLIFGTENEFIDFEENKNKHNKFSTLGELKKLTTLKKEFHLISPFKKHLKTFIEARNCITHQRGFITPERCNQENKFVLSWRRVKYEIKGKDGIRIFEPTHDLIANPVHLEKGDGIRPIFVDAEHEFPINSTLEIPTNILKEICFSMLFEIEHLQELMSKICTKSTKRVKKDYTLTI